MTRTVIYSILGATISVFFGLAIGIGQYIGSGNLSILAVIIFGAIVGAFIGNRLNKKSF